ncbi:hypothetical protein TNCT_393961 [Trichonephila clavata]|uniref:Uncharacterized protein n=1 Tax=Trichonephila clavata TaxID=2740835 RepID=A0A8X6H065_TRICU|nr:hypothetical protein TNCT_393961 [Trichonephila clavata]
MKEMLELSFNLSHPFNTSFINIRLPSKQQKNSFFKKRKREKKKKEIIITDRSKERHANTAEQKTGDINGQESLFYRNLLPGNRTRRDKNPSPSSKKRI